MTSNGWIQILIFGLAVLAVARPLGTYLARVYDGTAGWLRPVFVVTSTTPRALLSGQW